jgi:copper(I)-binding protein
MIDQAAARRGQTMRGALVTIVLAALAALSIAGCSGGASQAPSGGKAKVEVSAAWARPSMSIDGTIAIYLVMKNTGGADDALVKAETPVGMASLHETMAGDSGMMGMQPLAKIAIPKGATTELKPGGYHIMVEKLTQTVAPGSTIDVTLTFEKSGTQTVKAEVRAG